MTSTPQTIEQRIANVEAELVRINARLSTPSPQQPPPPTDSARTTLPFGIFADDPYFNEILQRLRQERELDDENPAYT